MREVPVAEIAAVASGMILGASESIYMMGFEGEPLFNYYSGLTLQDVAALCDQRLQLRSVQHRIEKLVTSRQQFFDTEGRFEERRLGPWRARIVPFVPPAHMLLIDRQMALYVDLASPSKEEAVYLTEDAAEIDDLVRVFESAWSGTPRLIYIDEVQVVSALQVAEIATVSASRWQGVIDSLIRNPHALQSMDSREFEELVAELLNRDGFEVKLTPAQKDGGRDVLAYSDTSVGRHLYYVECKRYSPQNPVGVGIVRELYGVVAAHQATAGLIVTTSRFTSGALDFRESVKHQMSLKDYEHVCSWLKEHALG